VGSDEEGGLKKTKNERALVLPGYILGKERMGNVGNCWGGEGRRQNSHVNSLLKATPRGTSLREPLTSKK